MYNEEQLVKDGYLCTDPNTGQYMKALTDKVFHFVEQNLYDPATWDEATIDLAKYTTEQQNEYVESYYDSLELLRIEYGYGTEANSLIAECIFEQMYDK